MKVVSLAFALLGVMNCFALQRFKPHSYQPIPTEALDSDIESNCELTDIVVESSVCQLVLIDGQRLAFEKNLLEQSEVLTMLLERSPDHTISVPRDIISSHPAKDAVTLADLHEILRVIAENENPEQGLRKLLLPEISAPRALSLIRLAIYYDIQPLFELMKEQFAEQSLEDEAWKKQIGNIFSEYAQKEVVSAYMMKDQQVIEAMLHNEEIRTPLFSEIFHKVNTYKVHPTHASLKSNYLLFSCLDQYVYIIDIIKKKYVFKEVFTAPIKYLAWSGDGDFFSVNAGGETCIFKGLNGEYSLFKRTGDFFLKWLQSSSLLMVDVWRVCIVDYSKNKNELEFEHFEHPVGHGIIDAHLSPNQKYLACLCTDKCIRIFNLQERIWEKTLPDKDVIMAWSPNSRYLADISLDGHVRIWDTVTGKTILVEYADLGPIRLIGWQADSRILKMRNKTDDFLFDVEEHTFKTSEQPRSMFLNEDATISPNGAFRVSLSPQKLFEIWDTTKNILLYTLPLHIITKDYVRGSFGNNLHVDYILWLPDSTAFIYNIRCHGQEHDVFYNQIYMQRILTDQDFLLTYDEMKAFKNGDAANLPAPFEKALESYSRDKKICPQIMNVIKNYIQMAWRHKYETIGMFGFGAWLMASNQK